MPPPSVVGPIDSIRLGFVGAPIASCISINLMFITMFLYSIFRAPRDAWGGWTPELLSGFGLNIKLGLAGIGMVGSEWWSWEIVGLATSFLGPTALAAQSVLREWWGFMLLFLLSIRMLTRSPPPRLSAVTSASAFYQFQYALSVAAAVRIGSESRHPDLLDTREKCESIIADRVPGFQTCSALKSRILPESPHA